MSDPIRAELIGLKRLEARLGRLEPSALDKLRIFMARFTIALSDRVKQNIVDRFRSTGPLYQSVRSQQIEDRSGITGRVYTDGVAYAAAQEYGARTPPHVILPKNGTVLAFLAPGSLGLSSGGGASALVFAKRVNHPGSTIPERSYARLALVQMRGDFQGGIREVVSEAISEAFAIAAE